MSRTEGSSYQGGESGRYAALLLADEHSGTTNQRYATDRCPGVFYAAIGKAFEKKYPDYRLHMRNLSSREVFDRFWDRHNLLSRQNAIHVDGIIVIR
jgi:hypothetical protein